MTLGATAWVDKNIKAAWPRLQGVVPASWLPLVMTEEDARMRTGSRRKFAVEELGCGHYGCVMPTEEPELVCKLTSDISEARFVSAYLSMPPRDTAEGGIVEYRKILALHDQSHIKRPLFLIWRSEAYDVGFIVDVISSAPQAQRVQRLGIEPYQIRAIKEGAGLLTQFLTWAKDARDRIDRLHKRNGVLAQRPDLRGRTLSAVWNAYENAPREADPRHYRGVQRVGVALAMCAGIAQEMANTDVVYPVGAALSEYLEEGLLLADVHYNNIGRNDQKQAVITDPGHVVAIHPRWASWPEVQVV
jgi:hypothetical protein